ncbi:unnamed protein product [Diabrotica balteata]|uniref:Uncharacterized protein n=1 Tax=Diabrotica balteata TaxID=107213 RepID=A0A9N9SRW5_DIABA|nr:unnamed protein product [Diabrotica balteata]
MEIKQKFSQDNCRAEIYSNKVNDDLLDTFKNDIKDESNRESTHDTFDDSDLNEYSLKIEIKEDEIKLIPYEEIQTKEKDTFKNEIKDEYNRESTHDTFDDSDLSEYSLKIEIKEDENKLMPYEEKQTKEKEPDAVYQDTYIKDYGFGDSDVSLGHIKKELTVEDMTFDLDQKQDDLGLQYSNSDVDNIKLEHTAKGSHRGEHGMYL